MSGASCATRSVCILTDEHELQRATKNKALVGKQQGKACRKDKTTSLSCPSSFFSGDIITHDTRRLAKDTANAWARMKESES
mmetsp:Transcript_30465/g.44501  ORF Transcript_30465/g.44501 Transcript_30465/m.44501 type:complete len:82 (-) Transcript_30465:258-503(-)